MSRGPSRFTQADIKRAVRGTVDAGLTVVAVSISPSGDILVKVGGEDSQALRQSPLDQWLEEQHAGKAQGCS